MVYDKRAFPLLLRRRNGVFLVLRLEGELTKVLGRPWGLMLRVSDSLEHRTCQG